MLPSHRKSIGPDKRGSQRRKAMVTTTTSPQYRVINVRPCCCERVSFGGSFKTALSVTISFTPFLHRDHELSRTRVVERKRRLSLCAQSPDLSGQSRSRLELSVPQGAEIILNR